MSALTSAGAQEIHVVKTVKAENLSVSDKWTSAYNIRYDQINFYWPSSIVGGYSP